MTITTRRSSEGRRTVVYGEHGTPIATVSQARAVYFTSLLAECDFGHCFLVPDDTKAWLSTDAGCPRCRALGIS